MSATSIEWTDHSVNPLRARLRSLGEDLQPIVNVGHYCEKVSPGCKNCYSSGFQPRFGMPQFQEQRGNASIEHWLDASKLEDVLKRRKPTKFFWCDMTDMFGEWVSFEHIATCFAVMAATPQHTHQVLTKRPGRAVEWFKWVQNQHGSESTLHARVTCYLSAVRPERAKALASFQDALRPPWPDGGKWPLPNVWLGVSAENQATADERIPLLLKLPAAVRFVSAEPLLGPLDLRKYLNVGGICECDQKAPPGARCEGKGRNGWIRCSAGCRRLDWVIAGGESGRGAARPCDVEWLESLVLQCREQLGMGIKPWPVPCFVKQLGAIPFDSRESDRCTDEPHPGGAAADPSCRLNLNDRKGGDMSEWPEGLRVRQFPEARA